MNVNIRNVGKKTPSKKALDEFIKVYSEMVKRNEKGKQHTAEKEKD